LLAQWHRRRQPIQGANIHGGGTAIFAQRTQNGYKKIFQVNYFKEFMGIFLYVRHSDPFEFKELADCVVFSKIAINSK